MRLIAWKDTNQGDGNQEQFGVVIGKYVVPLQTLNQSEGTSFPSNLLTLLHSGQFAELKQRASELTVSSPTEEFVAQGIAASECLSLDSIVTDRSMAPLYRRPRKIWGIGLNYVEHAGDLKAVLPTEEPASFMKTDTTLIGPGDAIVLPWQSERVTAEAEIAIVIGKECRNVSIAQAPDYTAGFVSIIDMTAEDILQKNPRFLTRAKNFDTFFSLGGELLTPEELPNLSDVTVGTYRNGELYRENVISHMMFDPWFLVSFHSQVATLLPGDIILSGTPGAAVIRDGDVAESRISGFLPLQNPVQQGAGSPF